MLIPNAPQLIEFYNCGMRTGYPNPRQAVIGKAAKMGFPIEEIKVENCAYCPGYHSYNPEETPGDIHQAEEAWKDFIKNHI